MSGCEPVPALCTLALGKNKKRRFRICLHHWQNERRRLNRKRGKLSLNELSREQADAVAVFIATEANTEALTAFAVNTGHGAAE
jgi:hypothetical protein